MKYFIIYFLLICICLKNSAQSTFYLRGHLEVVKTNYDEQTRLKTFHKLFPDDVCNNMVYSLSANSPWCYTENSSDYSSFVDDSYLELCKRMDKVGIKYVVNVGEIGNYADNPMPNNTSSFPINSSRSFYITTAQVEEIFKNTDNCVGIESGENFWTYNSTTINEVLNHLRVCKKYNKKYIIGEGGWGSSSWMRFFSDNYYSLTAEGLGAYLIPTFKNTKPWGAFVSMGAIQGAWISDIVTDFGIWNDEWAWCYHSFNHPNIFPNYFKADRNQEIIPYSYYLKTWLLSISQGGNCNFMETPSFNRDGSYNENFYSYLYPFIKALNEHNIRPTKAELLKETKALINPYGKYLVNGKTAEYSSSNIIYYRNKTLKDLNEYSLVDPYGMLFNSTYTFWDNIAYTGCGSAADVYYPALRNKTGEASASEAVLREVFPNNSRYGILPILSSLNAINNVPSSIEIVSLCDYDDEKELQDKMESLYSPENRENEAWAKRVGESFFVLNSHENADIDQFFIFDTEDEIFEISGVIPFQNILFGKREDKNNYWFQANGYIGNNNSIAGQKYDYSGGETIIRFKSSTKPNVYIELNKNSVKQEWDEVNNVLQLTISQTSGAVNFRVYLGESAQEITDYYIRTSSDLESWSSQENENSASVLSIDDISSLKHYPQGTTFYMANGYYSINDICTLSGLAIYGGFSGKESAITDLNKRVRIDYDDNGIIEPWEMKYVTHIQGDEFEPNNNNEKNIRLELLGGTVLDGVTIRNIHSAMDVPISVGAYINGFIDAVSEDPGSHNRGELVNCIVENIKTGPTFSSNTTTGLIGIGHYSVVKNCHIRNCETQSGVTQFINMSGYRCKFQQSVISNNSMNGSGVYIVVPKVNSIDATPIIENCIFTNNTGGSYGLIRAVGKQTDQESLYLRHCTFANNNNGGEIIGFLNSSGKVSNSILYSSTSTSSVRRITSGTTVNIISCLSSKAESGATNINSLSNFTSLEQYNFETNNYRITTPHVDSGNYVSGDSFETCEVDLLGYSRESPYTIGAFQIGSDISYPDPEITTGVNDVLKPKSYYNNKTELFHIIGYEQSFCKILNISGQLLDYIYITYDDYPISMSKYNHGIYIIIVGNEVYKIFK